MAALSVVKEKLLTRTDNITFILLTCLSVAAIVSFLVQWLSFGDWRTHLGSFLILTFIVFFRVANSLARWFILPFMKRPRRMEPREGLKVAVVTTFVPGAESLEMLDETVKALVALEYPHDTWVLDEGDDELVKSLCRRRGASHFSRKNLPHYQTDDGTFKVRCKHGNYNAWLYEVGFDRYEIITAFDPDHVPAPSFLSHVLGYFEDPKIGYVQAPQAYYNQEASFIARGAAEETYEYCSCTQMGAYYFGQPAVVGCHNTHRVKALKEVGGFAAHDADDLLIGLLYQAQGWNGVYVPRIIARGVTPVDWDGYLTQQLRWARSVIDVKYRLHHLLGKELSLTGRAISAVDGLFYLQNSITTFMGLLLLAYMLMTGDVPAVVSYPILLQFVLLVATLQLCAFYRQRFYLNPRREWGTHWRAKLLRYAKWPVCIWAFWDVAQGSRVPYILTRKVRAESHSYKLLIPHTLIIVLVSAAWVLGRLLGSNVPWLVYWITAAVMAVSFFLILTDYLHFPEPYEKGLLRQDA
ncbi:MAG: glycosyltransferase [Acidobacteria bacterium]|nr:glycosyltransferase [Acidobacteriota bacterium]